MYCIKCGNYFEGDGDFCENCLKEINSFDSIENVTIENNFSLSEKECNSKKGNKESIFKVCISVTCILMCIVCCILLEVSVVGYLQNMEIQKFRPVIDAIDFTLESNYSSQGLAKNYNNYKDVYVQYTYTGNGRVKDVEKVLVILVYNKKGFNFDYVYTVCKEIEIESAIKKMRENIRSQYE